MLKRVLWLISVLLLVAPTIYAYSVYDGEGTWWREATEVKLINGKIIKCKGVVFTDTRLPYRPYLSCLGGGSFQDLKLEYEDILEIKRTK